MNNFLHLEERLISYADTLNKTGSLDSIDKDVLLQDLLYATRFLDDFTILSLDKWNEDEEEFLKEACCQTKYGIDEVTAYISKKLGKHYHDVRLKIISFGFWGDLYDEREREQELEAFKKDKTNFRISRLLDD